MFVLDKGIYIYYVLFVRMKEGDKIDDSWPPGGSFTLLGRGDTKIIFYSYTRILGDENIWQTNCVFIFQKKEFESVADLKCSTTSTSTASKAKHNSLSTALGMTSCSNSKQQHWCTMQ